MVEKVWERQKERKMRLKHEKEREREIDWSEWKNDRMR